MGKTNKRQHDRKTLFWTIVGSIAGVAGAVIAYLAMQPHLSVPAKQNIVSPIISPKFNINVGNPNAQTISSPTKPDALPPNLALPKPTPETPAPQPLQKRSALTDAELQLLAQTKADGEIKMDLTPFLLTSDPAQKPSYSKLKQMFEPGHRGMDKIYKVLRQTNSATGEPWISAPPPSNVSHGVHPGTFVTEWMFDEPICQSLTNRQQVLLKYVPVLLKAGELSP